MPEAAVYGVSSYYDDLTQPRGERHVRVCTGTACWAADFDAQVEQIEDGLGLSLGSVSEDGSVSLGETVCLGYCHAGKAVRDGDVVDAGDGAIERVIAGEPVYGERARVADGARPSRCSCARPTSRACSRALRSRPRSSWPTVKDANLRGRGGAGFPAGMKWEFASKAAPKDKFIVVNGDEGDPGSYIDKYLMEYNPSLLIEGMAIAGYAVGATRGFVLVRSEYPRSTPGLAPPSMLPAPPAISARTSTAAGSRSTCGSRRAPARTWSARRPRS